MKELHICPTCGNQSAKYWQRVSPGMVDALIKFRRAIKENGRNSLHLYHDLTGANELTTAQQMNWTKLRFHGLVAKVYELGERKYGYWLLTTRGRLFLDGEVSVHRRVQTLNNKIVDRDPVLLTVAEVAKVQPQFDDYAFWHGTKEPVDIELAQVALL